MEDIAGCGCKGCLMKELEESIVKPMVIVNKMFAAQLQKTIINYHGEIPQHIRNLYADMNHMVKQYEEDASCH